MGVSNVLETGAAPNVKYDVKYDLPQVLNKVLGINE